MGFERQGAARCTQMMAGAAGGDALWGDALRNAVEEGSGLRLPWQPLSLTAQARADVPYVMADAAPHLA